MRYRRIDLNLLAALDVLLAERNVSRAAEALHLSQSAVSGILARLRDYFGDPLLVQVGRQLELTPLAESLRGPARRAMGEIDALIDTQPSFDPASAQSTVRIAASDYVISAYLIDTLRRIATLAPGLRVTLVPNLQLAGGPGLLETGAVDFAVVPAHLVLPDQPHQLLFEDDYTVLAWDGNPHVANGLTLDTYRQLGHVVFEHTAHSSAQPWFEQWYANEHGDTRRTEVRVAHFSLLGALVVGTERLATVQSRLARRLAQTLPLRCLPLPLASPPRLTELLQWPRHRQDDPAGRWVREQLLQGPDAP